MGRLLREIIRKLNFNLFLAVLGIALAITAFAFDIFGFGISRREAKETTESLDSQRNMLERSVERRISFIPVGYGPGIEKLYEAPFDPDRDYKIMFDGVGTASFDGKVSADRCAVEWESGGASYLITGDERSGAILVNFPEVDYFIGDYGDYLIVSIDGDKQEIHGAMGTARCDFTYYGRATCLYMETGLLGLNVFARDRDFYIIPTEYERSEFWESERAHDEWSDLLATLDQAEEKYLSRMNEDREELLEYRAKVRSSEDRVYRYKYISTQKNFTTYREYGRRDGLVRGSTENDRVDYLPMPPDERDIKFWRPDRPGDYYKLPIDDFRIREALTILKRCSEIPESDISFDWIATVE